MLLSSGELQLIVICQNRLKSGNNWFAVDVKMKKMETEF